jgi:hypothetical protein
VWRECILCVAPKPHRDLQLEGGRPVRRRVLRRPQRQRGGVRRGVQQLERRVACEAVALQAAQTVWSGVSNATRGQHGLDRWCPTHLADTDFDGCAEKLRISIQVRCVLMTDLQGPEVAELRPAHRDAAPAVCNKVPSVDHSRMLL